MPARFFSAGHAFLAQVRHGAIDFSDFEAVESGNWRRCNAGF